MEAQYHDAWSWSAARAIAGQWTMGIYFRFVYAKCRSFVYIIVFLNFFLKFLNSIENVKIYIDLNDSLIFRTNWTLNESSMMGSKNADLGVGQLIVSVRMTQLQVLQLLRLSVVIKWSERTFPFVYIIICKSYITWQVKSRAFGKPALFCILSQPATTSLCSA